MTKTIYQKVSTAHYQMETKIIIKRPFDVTIKINSEETKISTLSSTVNDVLTEYSSLIGDNYQLISPSNPSSHLSKNMVIEIEVQTERIETVTEEIPFETEYVDNAELDKGNRNRYLKRDKRVL